MANQEFLYKDLTYAIIGAAKEYREMFGISRPTSARDLRKLVETGWVREIGKGRSLRYAAR